MVYIDKESAEKVVFPRTKTGEIAKIEFINQLDKSVVNITNISVEYSLNIYKIEFDKENLKAGTYDYKLIDNNDVVLSAGICQINGFEPEELPSYTIEKNIIQYNG